jgi:uncharacterized membrane protein
MEVRRKIPSQKLVQFVFLGLNLLVCLLFLVSFLYHNQTVEVFGEPRSLHEVVQLISVLVSSVAVLIVLTTSIRGIRRESKEYVAALDKVRHPKAITSSSLGEEPISDTTPLEIFGDARERLLAEAVRLDAISRRNLRIGILFSVIALLVLSWPLISAGLGFIEFQRSDLLSWAAQYYLPRFAVGLLLQFVGFFFLRLYVANELDLKHNKNELTNIEIKMIGVQLAREFKDAASKKEIMKSLASTERNFIIKKNEKSISTESLAEYNDLRALFEKVIDKIPGTKSK